MNHQISTKWMSSWNPFKTFNLLQNSYQSRATSIPRHFQCFPQKGETLWKCFAKITKLKNIRLKYVAISSFIIQKSFISQISILVFTVLTLATSRRLCKYLGLFTILSSTLLGTTTEDAVALRGRAFRNIKDISALIVMECGKLSHEALTWLLCFRFR